MPWGRRIIKLGAKSDAADSPLPESDGAGSDSKSQDAGSANGSGAQGSQGDRELGDLKTVRERFNHGMGRSDDFRLREFRLGGEQGRIVLMAYLAGMVDAQLVDQHILRPLMLDAKPEQVQGPDVALVIQECLTTGSDVNRRHSFDAALSAILDGDVALFIMDCAEVLTIGASGAPHRSVSKPETEHSVRGSREGFTEVLGKNIALIRRRAKHQNLRTKLLRIGAISQTQVAVMYIEGLTNPEIVKTAMARLEAIWIDHVLESQTLISFLQDHPFTPFPLIRSTERPDEAVRVLMAGKVLILTDNTPFVLSVPSVMVDFYQTMEDYTFGFWGSSFVRLLRFMALLITFFLPALYISLIAVNPEMLPNELAITVARAREGLPFPPIVEVMIIEVSVELIREAALRLPQPLGTTIGVVGGVVVGQALVAAGVISPLMIVVAAVTMIASFTTPTLDMGFPWRILKWLIIVLSNMFGLLGIVVGTAVILGHLCSLSSFGAPYLTPATPFMGGDMGDTLVRNKLFNMKRRPEHLRPLIAERMGPYEQPMDHPNLYAGQKGQQQGGE